MGRTRRSPGVRRHSVPLNCLLSLVLSFLEISTESYMYDVPQLYGIQLLQRTRKDVVVAMKDQHHVKSLSDEEAALGLLRLLCGTSFRNCSVMQDYIFGILGVWKVLYGKDPPWILRPDYSLPFKYVYWGYASWLITQTGYLRVFSMSCPLQLRMVPSWVPDFSDVQAVDLDFRSPEKTVSISEDFKELHTSGYLVGNFLAGNLSVEAPPSGAMEDTIAWLRTRVLGFERKIVIPAASMKTCSTAKILNAWLIETYPSSGASLGEIRRLYELARPVATAAAITIEKFQRMKDSYGVSFLENLKVLVGLIQGDQYLLDNGDIVSRHKHTATRMQKGDKVYYLKGNDVLSTVERHVLRPTTDNQYLLLVTVFLGIETDTIRAWAKQSPYKDGDKWLDDGRTGIIRHHLAKSTFQRWSKPFSVAN